MILEVHLHLNLPRSSKDSTLSKISLWEIEGLMWYLRARYQVIAHRTHDD
jgi:hypothetical protein